jgi:hypothetical protein
MSKNIPTNKKLYARVKAEAKRKFDRWPSAYGSAWLVREYKKRGGGYRKAEQGMEVPEEYMYGGISYADSAYMYGGEDEYGYGGEDKYAKGGGIPQRYKNMGFTKVGAKKKSTRPGKKWMVLAKKGDKYKVVHGGYKGMKDFKQHGSAKRKKRFWDRMGGRDSAKAKDPFSPLYWHKRFGTWEAGGEFQPHMMYDPETGKGYEANKPEDHKRMASMGYLHEDEMQEQGIEMMAKYGKQVPSGKEYFNEDSMDFYAKGGTNNPGFRALPPEVQQNILDNMGIGGECYACGGQMKKYQSGSEYLPYPDDTGDLDVMYPNPNDLTQYDDSFRASMEAAARAGMEAAADFSTADVAWAFEGIPPSLNLKRKDIPRFDIDTPQLDLVPIDFTRPQQESEESEDNNNNRMLNAVGRVAAAGMLNRFIDSAQAPRIESQQRMNMLTDNFIPMRTGNNRGDYDINTGIFRPDDYVPVQFQSQFMSGGQTSMVDEETLKALIAAGADIELLD